MGKSPSKYYKSSRILQQEKDREFLDSLSFLYLCACFLLRRLAEGIFAFFYVVYDLSYRVLLVADCDKIRGIILLTET